MRLDGRRQNGPIRGRADGVRGQRSLAMVTRLLEEAGYRPRLASGQENSPDGMRGHALSEQDDRLSHAHIADLLVELVALFQPHAQGASLDLRLVMPEELPLAHLPFTAHFEMKLRRFMGEVIAAGHGQMVELQLKVLARAGTSWMMALSAATTRGDGGLHVLLPRVMFYLTDDGAAKEGLPP